MNPRAVYQSLFKCELQQQHVYNIHQDNYPCEERDIHGGLVRSLQHHAVMQLAERFKYT